MIGDLGSVIAAFMEMFTPVQIIAMTAIATMCIFILIAFEVSILLSLLFLHSEIKNIYSIIDRSSKLAALQCDERKSNCDTWCESTRPIDKGPVLA